MRRVNDMTVTLDDDALIGAETGRKGRKAKARKAPAKSRRRSVKLAGLAALAMVLAGLPAWAVMSGMAEKLAAQGLNALQQTSSQAGLAVVEIYVEGRTRTPSQDLLAALKVKQGDAILAIDLVAAKARVEGLAWVRNATIERRLPGVLHVALSEREPIAIWQNDGRYALIDREGVALPDDLSHYGHLPLVVGDDAHLQAASLIEMLRSEPALMDRVKAAQWISQRRWNVVLDSLENGTEVRLPEDDSADAWRRLAELDSTHGLLQQKLSMVDLRQPDRLVVRTDPIAPAIVPMTVPRRPKTLAGKDA